MTVNHSATTPSIALINGNRAPKDRSTNRRDFIFRELQNRYAMNCPSNDIHRPDATNALHHCVASLHCLHNESKGHFSYSRHIFAATTGYKAIRFGLSRWITLRIDRYKRLQTSPQV